MLELEIYAAGVRQTDNIMSLGHEFEMVEGFRYKVDSNHDIVYFEMDSPVMSLAQIVAVFQRIGLEPRVIGTAPAELRPKAKTQLIKAS